LPSVAPRRLYAVLKTRLTSAARDVKAFLVATVDSVDSADEVAITGVKAGGGRRRVQVLCETLQLQ
jgi:hypothetical protein